MEPEFENDKINKIYKENRLPVFSSIITFLSSRQKNKFYVANSSLWVVFLCMIMGLLVLLFVNILHVQEYINWPIKQFVICVVGASVCIFFWVSIFYKEKKMGYHTDAIKLNITLGFTLFLFTEALCFLSLFWTFFHALLAASTHVGQFAPGEGIVNYYLSESIVMQPSWNIFYFSDFSGKLINLRDNSPLDIAFDKSLTLGLHFNLYDNGQLISPYGYPLINTGILVASAAVLNMSHVFIKQSKYFASLIFLSAVIILGIIFTLIQYKEIKSATFQYSDGIYSCSFYSLTGLHGIHVILGIFALGVCLINFLLGNYTLRRHQTYSFAIVYWHFVDVIWILVYLLIYCWPAVLFYGDDLKVFRLRDKEFAINISVSCLKHVFEHRLDDDIKIINKKVMKINQENELYKNLMNYLDNAVDFYNTNNDFTFDVADYFEFIEEGAIFHDYVVNMKTHFSNLHMEDLKGDSKDDFITFLNEKHEMWTYKNSIILGKFVERYDFYKKSLNDWSKLNFNEFTREINFYPKFLIAMHSEIFNHFEEQQKHDLNSRKKAWKFAVLRILKSINEEWAYKFTSRALPWINTYKFRELWSEGFLEKKVSEWYSLRLKRY